MTQRRKVHEALAARPLLLAAVSAGFLAVTLAVCIAHDWRLDEVVGSGRRGGPLWILAFVGLPFWTLGVGVGIWRAVVGPRGRGGSRE
ncbi:MULTISPECIES: hypothetical protein [unclassified Rathayibacter]|uniref:hypothetical protein n=1 Tax=unclassified Rathayibacter TaxID=2609250 RepID=UPI0006FCB831|nr:MULTISPECIES: hypothetical protein [unclassified Rathayibacter]KQQ04087.1 hypothetical protein ASF42_11755 [Rathayibacter sp. Leaf294]KQS12541.1 hypothetical protein ASG06_11755 [Rathayibacter sp. Leaf185]